MKKKKIKKSYFGIIFAVLVLMACLFVPNKIGADSGWDGSYDSSDSSSYDDSSSGPSSSHWGSSSSHRSDYKGDSSNDFKILAVIGIITLIIFVIATISWAILNHRKKIMNQKLTELEKSDKKSYYYSASNSVQYKKIFEILPDFNEQKFIEQVYDIYKKIQVAWMNFDYEALQKYTTNSLYNLYKGQLEILNNKNQQNMMEAFKLLNFQIVDISKNTNEVAIKVRATISCYDYIMDRNTNKILRGKKDKKVYYDYEMTFIRSIQEGVNKCPNCGVTLENNQFNTCPYCNSTIIADHYDWVLSKKEVKNQWIV